MVAVQHRMAEAQVAEELRPATLEETQVTRVIDEPGEVGVLVINADG